jgi:hypothetical protein
MLMVAVDRTECYLACAERELGAFMSAVSDMFGMDHARRAAHDWLDEFEKSGKLPETERDFETVTIAAAVRVATRMNSGAEKGFETFPPR